MINYISCLMETKSSGTFLLQQAMKALTRSSSIALLLLELRRQMGLTVNVTDRPLCTREKDALDVTQEYVRATYLSGWLRKI
jgi:hypothetical protein